MVISPRLEPGVPLPVRGLPTLTPNGRKARLGAGYVRLICNEAGYTFNETNIDEDVLSIDAEIPFKRVTVRLQIKCSGLFKITGRSATYEVEPGWLRNWADCGVPVYFVLVKIDDESSIRHDDLASAFQEAPEA